MSTKTNIRTSDIIGENDTNLKTIIESLKSDIISLTTELDRVNEDLILINSSINVLNSTIIPVGSMIVWAASEMPDKYLLCDGSAYSRSTYQKLFNVIGTLYGSGDGNTTFNLPNMIDRFAQGATTVGQYIEAGLPNVSYGFRISDNVMTNVAVSKVGVTSGTAATASASTGSTAIATAANVVAKSGNDTINVSLQNANAIYGNSDTVQPPALKLKYLIKYD